MTKGLQSSGVMAFFSPPTAMLEENTSSKILNALAGMSTSGKPIVAGPWLSEVGFELLYWIPFLQWVVEEFNIPKERIRALSRGGVKGWYQHVGGQYSDILASFTSEQFRQKNLERSEAAGTQKHRDVAPFDLEIVQAVPELRQSQDFEWLHPLYMYRLFEEFWSGQRGINWIEEHTRYKPLAGLSDQAAVSDLPEDFVAVKFYFSKAFPKSKENEAFIVRLLRQLASRQNVVLLNTGLSLDDHKELAIGREGRISTVEHLMTPETNLAVQSAVIARAGAFWGTYGGFSYLAPFTGVPSFSFYSRENKLMPSHLDVAMRASRVLKFGSFDGMKIPEGFASLENAEFTALPVRQFERLLVPAADNSAAGDGPSGFRRMARRLKSGIGRIVKGRLAGKKTLNILFLLHAQNRRRNFASLILALREAGHSVTLAYAQGESDVVAGREKKNTVFCPRERSDRWQRFAAPLRRFRDYLRYLEPRYASSPKLANRASEGVDSWFMELSARPWLRSNLRRADTVLNFIEKLVPCDARMNDFVREQAPDVVLVSPLVQKGAEYQVDYVKASHNLGIPVAFLPFSWDNLTNKGLMRIQTDRVFVWNETQRAEAVDLHGVSPSRLRVCGAWRFDEFINLKPSSGYEEHCRRVGLAPDRPYLSYLCSSEFVAPDEIAFVKEWIREIRREPALARCGILIRPYPDRQGAWTEADFSGFENVRVDISEPKEAMRGLYDNLHHCVAAVGLNTSAMIEAAILGKPVHSLLVEKYKGGQAGTLHFQYFTTVAGGLIHLAANFDEHRHRLVESVEKRGVPDSRSVAFTRAFVRPLGLNAPATPVAVREIERLAATWKMRRFRMPWAVALEPIFFRLLDRGVFPVKPAAPRKKTVAAGEVVYGR